MLKFIFNLSLPIQLVVVLTFAFFAGDSLPLQALQICYAASMTIKSGLIFILPFVVFGCLFSSVLEFSGRKGAVLLIVSILCFICSSNFTTTLIGYFAQKLISQTTWIKPHSVISGGNDVLLPYWDFSINPLVSNDIALLAGLVLGLAGSFSGSKKIGHFAKILKKSVDSVLNLLFIPLVPLFVLGFSLKLQYEKTLGLIVREYTPIFMVVSVLGMLYLVFLFFLGAGFRLKPALKAMKTVAPSALSGFSTMSSAATLPLTLKAAEINTKKPKLSRIFIPATVNNHLIGAGLFIPFVSLLLLNASGKPSIDFAHFLPFAFYFVLAEFAVAGVPGGGIVVMIPILEKYLGVDTEMQSLLTTLYLLFDPFITAANVSGNGAMAILFSKGQDWFSQQKVKLNDGKKPV